MTLSTSRQQFLAHETQGMDDIQYSRKGGIFVSTCVCIGYILLAVIVASLVGVIVYVITYYKLSQQTTEFWNEAEPFGQSPSSSDLRLPSDIEPSFYRLKIKANLDNSSFTGDVSITIRTSKKTKEIILHSKDLRIKPSAKLTEQIYEKVDSIHSRSKRKVDSNETMQNETTTILNNVTSEAPVNITNKAIFVTETPANNTPVISTVTEPTTTTTTAKVPMSDTPIDAHTQVTHSSVRNIKIISITEGARDQLLLKLASALKPDVDYILELSFEGKISNSLTGFYKSSYTNNKNEVKTLGVTQFEPTSARAAFPCFDEPAFKAKFEISIAHPKHITVLSNMKVSTQEFIADEPDWQWTHFERSVKMSTYLVAYTLTDFKSLETSYISKENVTKPIRIWARPELITKAKYASTITPRLLEYYENVFGLPYALDKLDLIAIPDFSTGAMENWGLITFRETNLLFDETDSVPRDKQNVAIDIAHELAHQWFGNLVTMKWWTDLWLNEGFATYIEYVGVDHIEPEWNMLESFTRDKMDLLRSDALKNTSPVSRQVTDGSEIAQKFDEISYIKGANLIRMLNHTMSEELFLKGLLHYLNQWKYSNAEENDLWQAMSSASQSDPVVKGHSLVDFMNSWTKQAGYPVINVNRDYDSGNVKFEQRLFSSSSEPYKKMVDQIWQIPISYTSVSAPLKDWSTKPKLWLSERSTSAKVDVNSTQGLYVNVGAIGYYRVNYDQKNWELLSDALKSGNIKSPVTRAQLIDDAFNLAKASQLNYSLALELTSYIKDGEESKIVWDLLLNNLAFLRHNLKATSGYRYFQDYVRTILSKQLTALNYGLTKPKDDNEAFLVENLVTWECHVEAPRCLRWARERFDAWARHPAQSNNTIPSYLRALVYNMAMKHGTRQEFDVLWNLFLDSPDPSVKSLVISHLPSTKDESLITMLLEKSLTEIPKQYAVAAWSVEPPVGTAIAQRFLMENFDRVYNKFTEMDAFMFPAVLTGAFGLIATEQELDTLKAFAMKHKEKLQPMSQTLQKLVDTAALRIGWVERHAHAINAWFKDYVTGKPSKPETPVTEAPTINNATSTTVKPDVSRKNNTNIALNVSHEASPKETPAQAPAVNETAKVETTTSASV